MDMKYTTCVNRKRTAWRRNVQSQSYGRASKFPMCIKLRPLAILKFPVPPARVRFNTRPILLTPRLKINRNSPPDVPYFSYANRNTMLGKAVESLSPRLQAGRPQNHGSNPGRDLSLLKKVRAVYGPYQASYSLGTGCSFLGRTVTKT
jgi:hypothetical protein